MSDKSEFVILISANTEWRVVRSFFHENNVHKSPYGEWFDLRYKDLPLLENPIIFFHGGWGKVSAAGSTQYAILTWRPQLIVNLGTCGGFDGRINIGDIILAENTIIYDIYEQMGDPDEHIKRYSTIIDNSWLTDPLPLPVIRTLLISGDRDLFCDEIGSLNKKYGAIAGDWESGAIAWVAGKNHTPCLILRGVTDLVSDIDGGAYDGNIEQFYHNTEIIMSNLLDSLPGWLSAYVNKH